MSRTIRDRGRFNAKDGDLQSLTKDKNLRKRFMWRGEGWSCKAQGGVGNKRGWKVYIPLWLVKKLKKEPL